MSSNNTLYTSKSETAKKRQLKLYGSEEKALEILVEIALIELLRIQAHETINNYKKTFKSNV